MGQLQNISGEDLEVPSLRREVKAGETVEVDDALLAAYVWPEATWAVPTQAPTTEPAPAVEATQE